MGSGREKEGSREIQRYGESGREIQRYGESGRVREVKEKNLKHKYDMVIR